MGNLTILIVEAMAMRQDIYTAIQVGPNNTIVEGDSKILIRAILGNLL